MYMEKRLTRLLLLWLFLMVTATTCEDVPEPPKEVLSRIKDIELRNWDNAGELPEKPVDNKVPKEAYLLEICLLTEEIDDNRESYYDDYSIQHVLSDAVEKIQIFTVTDFNEKFPKGSDVTSCFSEYPKQIDTYQRADYTAQGGVISSVDKTNRIYKALMTIPAPGEYCFRVLLTMESGEIMERVSEPITLY